MKTLFSSLLSCWYRGLLGLLAFCGLFGPPLPARAQQFRLASFATVPGAPQGFVYASVQDHRGFLWIGTGDGLYRYDGATFQRYSRANGLTEDFVTALYEDASGRLWVGHYQGGLSCLPETGLPFRRVRRPETFTTQVVGMSAGREGVWVASQQSGLLFLPDIAPDRTQFFPLPSSERRLLRSVAEVNGHLFVAFASGGLTEVAIQGTNQPLRARGPQLFYNTVATVMLPDTAGQALVVGTDQGAALVVEVTATGLGAVRALLPAAIVRRLAAPLAGGFFNPRTRLVWLASQSGTVLSVALPLAGRAPGAATTYPLAQQLGPFPLSTVLEDAEGTLWLGTAGDGLRGLTDRQVALFGAEAAGLPSPNITAVARVSGARLLVGTPRGLFQTAPDAAGGLRSVAVAGLPAGLPIRRLLYTPRGVVWVGTQGRGLWRAAPDSAFRRVRLPGDALTVSALALDPQGRVWVGTEGQGAYWLSGQGQIIRHYSTSNGLLHNALYEIFCDSHGNTWFGTHGTGLTLREPGGRLRVVRLTAGGVDINAITETADGDVWLATAGDGLFQYHHDTFVQHTVETAPGLVSDYAYSLLALTNGTLLIGHQNGLTIYQMHQNRFRRLDRPDDRSPDLLRLFNPAAAAADPAGLVRWFGTSQGLLRLARPAHRAETYVPAAVITDQLINDQLVPAQALAHLPYGTYKVQLNYRGVALAEAAALQYRYRLIGNAPEWSPPTTTTEATFRQLQQGHYGFEVQARLSARGAWSLPARLNFEVETPFWKTWWFVVVSILATVGLIRAYFLWRFRQHEAERRALERAVAERTQELQQEKERTEQINAELRIAKEAADTSRKAKAQFLANMSHEIRTPMNAVVGLTNLLNQTEPSTEQTDYIQAIGASAQNLMVIINDILDSSKIEAGKLTLEHTPFRLPDLVRQLRQLFRAQAAAKDLTLTVDVAPNVPEAVLGDPVRLNQILINLLGNAIKFTPHGSVTLSVSREADSLPGPDSSPRCAVRFAVRDTGVGIPADKLDTIFEDFSQANTSTTRQFGGTGLGLSIARSLVELHGGQLTVESREGQGSTFAFTLSYAPTAAAALPRHGVPTTALTPFEPPLRVLVVEDNDLNQLVARRTLERWNCHVTLAANGRLGLEAVRSQPFDVVLMDVQMPEMDGYEATRRIRRLPAPAGQIPILGLTASVLPEDRQHGIDAGMNDTLSKPFDPAHLHAQLQQFAAPTDALRAPVPAPALTPAKPATGNVSVPVAPPAKTSATPDEAEIDLTTLRELAPDQPAFAAQLIGTFLQQTPALTTEMQQAAAAADWPTLSALAHKIKGQVGYFGLPSLFADLAALEAAARSPTSPQNGSLATDNEQLCQRLLALLPPLQVHQQALPAPH